MKTLFLFLSMISGISAFANPTLVCKSTAPDTEVTLALVKTAAAFEMSVYRVAHGHAFPPQRVLLQELPETSGSLVVYGTSSRSHTLALRFLEGTFTDQTIGQSLPVICESLAR